MKKICFAWPRSSKGRRYWTVKMAPSTLVRKLARKSSIDLSNDERRFSALFLAIASSAPSLHLGRRFVTSDKDSGVDNDGVDARVLDKRARFQLARRFPDLALVVDIPCDDVYATFVCRFGGESVEALGVGRVTNSSNDADVRVRGEQFAGVAQSEAAGSACRRR